MNSRLRRAFFWAHLVAGTVAALFILNMAVSGILIAYQVPITQWAEQSQRTVTVPTGMARLDLETLIGRAQQARPQARFYRLVHHSNPAAAESIFGPGDIATVLYVNPYTGEVLGEGQETVRQFFRFMTGWHRWLAFEGGNRAIGKAVTGVVSLFFFGLLLSGLFLWLPKQWSSKSLGQIATFRRGLTGKARNWNWHNVAGIWCAPLILIVALTGILMSYSWATNLLYRVTGNPPLVQRAQAPRPKATEVKPAKAKPANGTAPNLNPDGLNQLFAVAETKVPGWKTISLVLSSSPDAPANFFISGGAEGEGRPDLTAQLLLNRHTGAVLKWQSYESKNLGEKLQTWIVPIHTGTAGGLLGETLAVLSACGTILLAWTGLSLAWRRFFGGGRISLDAIPAAPTDLIPETTPPES